MTETLVGTVTRSALPTRCEIGRLMILGVVHLFDLLKNL